MRRLLIYGQMQHGLGLKGSLYLQVKQPILDCWTPVRVRLVVFVGMVEPSRADLFDIVTHRKQNNQGGGLEQ